MNDAQRDFSGGLNLLDDPTKLGDTQYPLLINGRSRFRGIEPTKQNELQEGLPDGNYQGGIGVGNIAVAFVSGLAYYRREGETNWFQIVGFAMDALVERLWTCAVPKSTYEYIRKLDNSANAPMLVTTDYKIAGNPAGVVVQDGINQPWLIEFNATTQLFVARVTKTYAQWDNTGTAANSREYVPIGLQMFYVNQKLYVVARDRKSIYHSITGRPLDFMVNVNRAGNKLATELAGGAASVSFAMDSDEITCVRTVNIPNSFVYATAKRTRIITADYTRTLFDEPKYTQTAVIEVGVNNQESFCEILGDYVFADNEGIKSFNAVKNLYVEGLNSVFSLPISKLFKDFKLTNTAVTYLDNYAMFYAKTIYGNAILVYDALRGVWASMDVTTTIKIKQFFTTESDARVYLYAVSDNGQLWKMYSSTNTNTTKLYIRNLTTPEQRAEHKGQIVKTIFRRGSVQTGTVRVTELTDEKLSEASQKNLVAVSAGINYPVRPPVQPNNSNLMSPLTFPFTKGLNGNKLAYIIQWDSDAQLTGWEVVTTESNRDVGFKQTSDT